MTVMDVVSLYRKTEIIFKKYEKQAGACICCQALDCDVAGIVRE